MRHLPKPTITPNDKATIRLMPGLAAEIGLNESLILQQLCHWIKIAPPENFKDGMWWVWKSTQEMKTEVFKWCSISGLNRAIKSLSEQNLIFIGNYNRHKYDKTRWFAINAEAVNALESVQIDLPSAQNEQGSNQNEPRSNQDGEPIPEITPENLGGGDGDEETTIGESLIDPAAKTEPTQGFEGESEDMPPGMELLVQAGVVANTAREIAGEINNAARIKAVIDRVRGEKKVQNPAGLIIWRLKHGDDLPVENDDDATQPPDDDLDDLRPGSLAYKLMYGDEIEDEMPC